MKSLIILSAILRDASVSTGVDTTRDLKTIRSRIKDEGDSFLTITLPAFSQWFESSIEEGKVVNGIFSKFRKSRSRKGSALPCFLHGFTSLVFDKVSGLALEKQDVNAVFFVRQICLLFKKILRPCSAERQSKALIDYEETDSGLDDQDDCRNFPNLNHRLSCNYLMGSLMANYDKEGGFPKHGPGATFEKLEGNQKFTNRDFYDRWSDVFQPEDLYGNQTWRMVEGINIIEEDQEKPVKVTLVPKTLKSPRVIAVEPVAMQYAQQLVASRLITSLEKSFFAKNLDIRDQSQNRKLALLGSRSRKWATIDLSEASDRVSLRLVRSVFSGRPTIFEELYAVRSKKALLPSGKIISLKKYASMGSATTFPVETIVFFCLASMAIAEELMYNKGRMSLFRATMVAAKQVFVYGDDIIVPAEYCNTVMTCLEANGLKINRGKTFSKGPFRESCGMDAFNGVEITPVYIRQEPVVTTKSADRYAALVAFSNISFEKGLWITADEAVRLLPSRPPLVTRRSAVLGLWHYTGAFSPHRYSEKRMQWEVKGYRVVPKKMKNLIWGYDALRKHLISKMPNEDPKHLEIASRRYETQLRSVWVSP